MREISGVVMDHPYGKPRCRVKTRGSEGWDYDTYEVPLVPEISVKRLKSYIRQRERVSDDYIKLPKKVLHMVPED